MSAASSALYYARLNALVQQRLGVPICCCGGGLPDPWLPGVGRLLHASNVGIPVFDRVEVHCLAALDWSMAAALPLEV